jgi:cation:H+ antiporter
MRTLVSSKVNQWTLLIATLSIVFSLGAGSRGGMPLVSRQQHERWLTAAQSLFAVVLISEFAIERWEALALLVPFLAQLVPPPGYRRRGLDVRMASTALYAIRRWPCSWTHIGGAASRTGRDPWPAS